MGSCGVSAVYWVGYNFTSTVWIYAPQHNNRCSLCCFFLQRKNQLKFELSISLGPVQYGKTVVELELHWVPGYPLEDWVRCSGGMLWNQPGPWSHLEQIQTLADRDDWRWCWSPGWPDQHWRCRGWWPSLSSTSWLSSTTDRNKLQDINFYWGVISWQGYHNMVYCPINLTSIQNVNKFGFLQSLQVTNLQRFRRDKNLFSIYQLIFVIQTEYFYSFRPYFTQSRRKLFFKLSPLTTWIHHFGRRSKATALKLSAHLFKRFVGKEPVSPQSKSSLNYVPIIHD